MLRGAAGPVPTACSSTPMRSRQAALHLPCLGATPQFTSQIRGTDHSWGTRRARLRPTMCGPRLRGS